MAVTSHVYPKAMTAINKGTINLAVTTSSPVFKALLCTGDASTWGATQEAYQYVSDITGAYTEVAGGGDYARTAAFVTCTVTNSGATTIWKCTSPAPITFGAAVTISARSMFIYTTQVGSADASYPVIAVIDFGTTVASTAGAYTYTEDATNGLVVWTSSL